MKNSDKLLLIDGTFTHDEAKEILSTMISSKINFHNIKNWSSQERFGKVDEVAHRRLPLLRNEMEKLKLILSEANNNNKNLVISSEIKITLMDK